MKNVLYQFIEFFCLNLHTDELDQGQLELGLLLEVGLSSAAR